MKELEAVVLTRDIAEHGLKKGDVGTVVLVHKGHKGYEVEFTTIDGKNVAVVTLAASEVRRAGRREVPHARPVAR